MSTLAAWLDHQTRGAPLTLAARARAYAMAMPSGTSTGACLAEGSREALARALSQPGDRSAALDLLAADALITLALLAQAETAPETLGDFARALLAPEYRAS